jgi:hypothetical protein
MATVFLRLELSEFVPDPEWNPGELRIARERLQLAGTAAI